MSASSFSEKVALLPAGSCAKDCGAVKDPRLQNAEKA